MESYARWLFGIAALFNLLVGLTLLSLRRFVIALLHLDPIWGSSIVLANLTGMFVALFGYAYLRIAMNPGRHRPYIHLGAAGKLLAVVCVVVPWWMGEIPVILPILIGADFIFALLFLDFLRRTA